MKYSWLGVGAQLAAIFAQASIVAGQVLTPVAENCVQISGRLGQRHAATADYLVALHDRTIPAVSFDMLEPFQQRGTHANWDGEYAGKWLDAACRLNASAPGAALAARVDAFAAALSATQLPDGYMGISTRPGGSWDLWNMWYVLHGMLSHYEFNGAMPSLQCAAGAGSYIVAQYLPPKNPLDLFGGAWGGGCNIDVLDQLMRLNDHSPDAGLVGLGDHIAQQYAPIQSMRATGAVTLSHAYVVSAYLGGMVQYSRVAGHPEEIPWLAAVWNDVASHHQFHTCSIGMNETFNPPPVYSLLNDHQETCATVEWMNWTAALYNATGDVRYAHALENSIYNALLGAQSTDGQRWLYHTRMNGGPKPWFQGLTLCCFWSGPRGIARLPGLIYRRDSAGIRVDLFESSTANIPDVNGVDVSIIQQTDYPATGHVSITLTPARPVEFALSIRLPVWAENLSLTVDGQDAGASLTPGSHAVITRRWQAGDVVDLDMTLGVRMRTVPAMTSIAGAVIQRGPEVLSIDQRDNPGLDLDSASWCGSEPLLDEFDPMDGRRRYQAPALINGTPGTVVLTPFADAGDGAAYRTVLPIGCGPVLPADLNDDGIVNSLDFGILLSSWSIPSTAPGCGGSPGSCPADLNGDGFVNSLDLGVLLSSWTV